MKDIKTKYQERFGKVNKKDICKLQCEDLTINKLKNRFINYCFSII